MSFELHITCSKDIDKLKIDFSDGTSVATTSTPKEPKEPKKKTTKKSTQNNQEQPTNTPNIPDNSSDFLDTEMDFSNTPREVVEKPVIPDKERPTNIAKELQNLDI